MLQENLLAVKDDQGHLPSLPSPERGFHFILPALVVEEATRGKNVLWVLTRSLLSIQGE